MMGLHLTFKVNGEGFINRYFHEMNGYSCDLPPLLQNYPEAEERWLDTWKNLNHLSIEMLSSYIDEKMLKSLSTKREEKELKPTFELSRDEEIDVEALLKENSLSKLNTNCLQVDQKN
jgi:hypothetical protein